MNVNEYLQVCEYVCEYLALNSPQALMQSSHPSNLLTQRRFVIVSPNLLLLFCSPSQEKNHRPSYYLSQRYRNHAQVQVQVNFHFPISTKNSRLLISGHKKISSLTDIHSLHSFNKKKYQIFAICQNKVLDTRVWGKKHVMIFKITIYLVPERWQSLQKQNALH